jgi:hypothetical protein
MNKLLYVLTAGAAAMVLMSGYSIAADEHPEPRSTAAQPGEAAPVMTAPEQAKQDEEYTAELKKCDSLTGGQKKKCVQAAQKKFNRL